MKPESRNNAIRDGHRRVQAGDERRQVRPGGHVNTGPVIDWELLGARLLQALRRLWVALSFRANGLNLNIPGLNRPLRLSWFRVGLIALAAFILTQKDVQFSVRMQAPAPAGTETARPASDTREVHGIEQMSLGTGLSFGAAETTTFSPDDLDDAEVRAYIRRFSRVARIEQEKYGIPASAKLAMAIIESGAGTSAAAVKGNNHFGIRLDGPVYNTAWDNWRAHSVLIQQKWPDLTNKNKAYRDWVNALQQSGYTRDAGYAEKLFDVIRRYDLDDIDDLEL